MAETVSVSMKIAPASAQPKEWKSEPVPYPDDATGRIHAEAKAIVEVIEKASADHGENRFAFLGVVKTGLTTCLKEQ